MDGYRLLTERFGAEAVADRLLAKWIADPEADSSWENLRGMVAVAPLVSLVERADEMMSEPVSVPAPPVRPVWEPSAQAPLTMQHRIILWHLSNGHTTYGVADHMGISHWTVRSHLKRVRDLLGFHHDGAKDRAGLVAQAIRTGIIP